MDQQTLYLGISLFSLVVINIILGSITGLFQQQFDKIKFWQGLLKGIVVSACFIGVLFIGKLTPDIFVVNIDGKDVNLGTATYLIMLSGYLYYGKEVLVKLSSFVKGDYKIVDVEKVAMPVVQPEITPTPEPVQPVTPAQ